MNKTVINPYRLRTSIRYFLAVTLILVGLFLAACLGETTTDSDPAGTLPPPPLGRLSATGRGLSPADYRSGE